jgi:AhpD family alkylhydroperoxidase
MGRLGTPNPAIVEKQHAFMQSLSADSELSPRLQELLRLRIAFHNQCRSCMAVRYEEAIADGLTEDLVCSLEKPQDADDLTEAERGALRFADLLATNHLAIDDAILNRLREFFTDRQVFEIGMCCAAFVGFGRFAAVNRITEGLPEEFQRESDQPLTPWGASEYLVRPLHSSAR